jgi:hypothetical protein
MKESKLIANYESEQLNKHAVKQRDIYQELRFIGLTHDQCSEVMDLIDTLPIEIKGVDNIKISVSNGRITVEPNHIA